MTGIFHIVVARKPLEKGCTIAENCIKHGCGALNIDGTRIPHGNDVNLLAVERATKSLDNGWGMARSNITHGPRLMYNPEGRWPANLIVGGEEVVREFPESGGGKLTVVKRNRTKGWCNASPGDGVEAIDNYGDSGSAARFFFNISEQESDEDLKG